MRFMGRRRYPFTALLLALAARGGGAVPSDNREDETTPPRVHDITDPHPAVTLSPAEADPAGAFSQAPVLAPPVESPAASAKLVHRALDRARKGLPAYPKVVEISGHGGAVATGHPLATHA